jgi:hypothetical protein
MLPSQSLMEQIFQVALRGCDVNVSARRSAIWDATVCLQADVLREADDFTRERLLRGLVSELRQSIAKLDELLRPAPPKASSETASPESTS